MREVKPAAMLPPADFEKRLSAIFADLRGDLEPRAFAGELLGLIFLRYADLRFEEATRTLEAQGKARETLSVDDYRALGVLFVPAEARSDALLTNLAHYRGYTLHRTLDALARMNPELAGVYFRDYSNISKEESSRLVYVVATLGNVASELRLIFEWVLERFGVDLDLDLHTPDSVAELMVQIVEPTHGTVHDPACGVGRLLSHCARYAERHSSMTHVVQYKGTEFNEDKALFCRMNMRVHDVSSTISAANSFARIDATTFDFVVTVPPLNRHASYSQRIDEGDPRFPFGLPTTKNANYLWIQLIYSALNDTGRGAFVMATSACSTRGSEREIRKRIIQTGAVEAIIALSPGLFRGTTLPLTLWILDKAKGEGVRREQVLFIDARHIHQQVSRGGRELSTQQVEYVADIVRKHRMQNALSYKTIDRPGLCKVATIDEIEQQNWDLNPGRYVGVAAPDAFRLRELHLTNVYGFEKLNLTFPDAQVAAVVGINGAGKSTILDSIAMFLAPLAAMLHRGDPKKAPYLLMPFAIRNGEKQAEAQLDIHVAGSTQSWKLATGRVSAKRTVDVSMRSWVERVHGALEADDTASVPVLCYYPAIRFRGHDGTIQKRRKSDGRLLPQFAAYEGAFDLSHQSLADVVDWFRREEDLENEIRLAGDSDHRNPRLNAVRQAVLGVLDSLSAGVFDDLRVRRDPRDTAKASLVLRKEGQELSIDTLSDGERGVVLLVADLAQRLAAANPAATDPLSGAGVVLIDEIELHLHPRWQRAVLTELIRTFRGCQFIVTTHSPQVLSRVPRDQIRLLSKFQVVHALPQTEGRDSNAILTELMGVSARPEEAEEEIAELARLIDDDALVDARIKWQELEARWPTDKDVLRLGAMIRALEDDAP